MVNAAASKDPVEGTPSMTSSQEFFADPSIHETIDNIVKTVMIAKKNLDPSPWSFDLMRFLESP